MTSSSSPLRSVGVSSLIRRTGTAAPSAPLRLEGLTHRVWRLARRGKESFVPAARHLTQLDGPSKVAKARLERSGETSVIEAPKPPEVLEVEAGVQTVRVELR